MHISGEMIRYVIPCLLGTIISLCIYLYKQIVRDIRELRLCLDLYHEQATVDRMKSAIEHEQLKTGQTLTLNNVNHMKETQAQQHIETVQALGRISEQVLTLQKKFND